MSFGYGVDIMAISGLALKVCTAYKDAPGDYRNISDEVESLHIIINKAAHHFESTTLSDNSRQEGHKVLRGCHNVLEDLDALIEKYNSLASASPSTSTSTSQVLQRLKLSASLVIGTEDIATLRARLTSNITLLNGFIQSCEFDKIQARLDSALGLRRTMSRDSIVSFAGSINTKKAYKKFCKGLFNIGVTADMISQKEKEIQDIFNTQHPAASSQIDDSTSTDPSPAPHPQLPKVGNSFDAGTPPIPSASTENEPTPRSRFGWVRPPIDFLVGPLMLTAAEEGDATRLISTLGYIRNINFKGGNQKETALHKAAAKGREDIVQLLLLKGASTEVMNSFNDTPLHLAARNGYTNIMELLLMNGASGESMNGALGGSIAPLRDAARNGYTSKMELLFSKGAPLEAKDTDGQTLLHRAAWDGHTSTVELFLSKGTSLEAKDTPGRTPVHCAARRGHTSTVELLLSKGASLEAMDRFWCTPLHHATMGGHTSTVELLLSKGASLEAKDFRGWTLVHYAAFNGHTSIVELLLSIGVPLEAKDTDECTPLHHVARNGHTSTVELLLSKGASLEAKDRSGWTPLYCAARFGHTRTVELLLSKGASLEAKDTVGWTSLHSAASYGHTSTVGLLLWKGASLEAKDTGGHTPLHCAARGGRISTVELLLSKGAPVEAMNEHGQTPLDVVSKYHRDIVKLLKSKAAKLENI